MSAYAIRLAQGAGANPFGGPEEDPEVRDLTGQVMTLAPGEAVPHDHPKDVVEVSPRLQQARPQAGGHCWRLLVVHSVSTTELEASQLR